MRAPRAEGDPGVVVPGQRCHRPVTTSGRTGSGPGRRRASPLRNAAAAAPGTASSRTGAVWSLRWRHPSAADDDHEAADDGKGRQNGAEESCSIGQRRPRTAWSSCRCSTTQSRTSSRTWFASRWPCPAGAACRPVPKTARPAQCEAGWLGTAGRRRSSWLEHAPGDDRRPRRRGRPRAGSRNATSSASSKTVSCGWSGLPARNAQTKHGPLRVRSTYASRSIGRRSVDTRAPLRRGASVCRRSTTRTGSEERQRSGVFRPVPRAGFEPATPASGVFPGRGCGLRKRGL